MRHSPRLHPSLLIALPAFVLVAALAACGSESDDMGAALRSGGENSSTGGNGTNEPTQNELSVDAAAPPADQYRGSPLCHIGAGSCDPDEATACGALPNPDAGIMTDAQGCRLAGPVATPECGDATLSGTDGAKCESGDDCAPGFDCVSSSGVGYCRRYCCTGSCGTHRSQNGAETFCDVQKLQGGVTKAPVCMPIKTCQLFIENECAESETCSVVTDDGTTGCVANGSAKAGESCDQEHCSAGLTCLGQAGSRKCFQLCRTTKPPACATGQVCKTSPIFPDPTIGVCTL